MDILLQPRRNKRAASKFFRKLLKGCQYVPGVLITDKLGSYAAAKKEVLPIVEHRQHKRLNNRAENAHQPTRQRERTMRGFKSAAHAQRFLAATVQFASTFVLGVIASWPNSIVGPELEPNQVLLTIDEVLTRKPAAGHFLELRTARLVTEHGSRYLSGIGALFLQRQQLAVLLCLGPLSSLLLIADGACPIRSFFTEILAALADKMMILDWHHLKQKCLELSSRICRGKTAKARFLRRLY